MKFSNFLGGLFEGRLGFLSPFEILKVSLKELCGFLLVFGIEILLGIPCPTNYLHQIFQTTDEWIIFFLVDLRNKINRLRQEKEPVTETFNDDIDDNEADDQESLSLSLSSIDSSSKRQPSPVEDRTPYRRWFFKEIALL